MCSELLITYWQMQKCKHRCRYASIYSHLYIYISIAHTTEKKGQKTERRSIRYALLIIEKKSLIVCLYAYYYY